MSHNSTRSVHSKELDLELSPSNEKQGVDDEFGGHDARRKLERKLVMKLDLRMSILIIIYILNYVRQLTSYSSHQLRMLIIYFAPQIDRNNAA